jgi:hypothetical protein
VYQEDLNPDIYSYDKLKFRVVVHIWHNDLELYNPKKRGFCSLCFLYWPLLAKDIV